MDKDASEKSVQEPNILCSWTSCRQGGFPAAEWH